MSKLQELIRELCPDGVEYKKLRDICKLNRGTRVVRNDLSKDGEFEVYQNSLTPLGYYDKSNYPAYTAFIISAGAAGEIGFTEKPIWAADDCLCLTCPDNISSKYVYYCLLNNKLFLSSRVRKASVPRLARTAVEQFEIPIPPLPVQEEIVRILDHFTNLAAELQAELQARKEQYEYYRNKLLTFEKDAEGVKWKRLPDICENLDRKRKAVTASNRTFGPYPYYGASGIVDYVSSYIFEGNYLLISEDGANLLARSTPIAFSISGKSWVNNHAHVLEFQNMFTQKYIEHYINMIDVSQYVSGGAQPKLNQENLNKIQIPVPSPSEQERIVSILDKFEALVNGLTEGLPAEIAAVQEQYEYYRNKLLSFPRTKISA